MKIQRVITYDVSDELLERWMKELGYEQKTSEVPYLQDPYSKEEFEDFLSECNYNDSIDSEEVMFDPEDIDRLYALFLDELENGETE